MRKIGKKIFASFTAALVICMMLSVTAFAATTLSESKSYGTMNAINGGSVTVCKTFYGTTSNHTVNPYVKLFLNVSSGSDPFMLTLKSPSGTIKTIYPSLSTSTYTFTDFNGEDVRGSWCITITNLGYSYNPNQIIPTTTAKPTLTIYYQ